MLRSVLLYTCTMPLRHYISEDFECVPGSHFNAEEAPSTQCCYAHKVQDHTAKNISKSYYQSYCPNITKVIAQILPKVLSVSQVHISMASLNGCLCTQTVSARSHCQKYCQVMTKVITKMLSQVLISMAPLNGSMVVYAHKEGSSSYYSEVARLTLASGEAIEASKRNYHHTITLPLPHLLQGTAEWFPKILPEILHLVGPSGCSVTTVGLQRQQHHRGCATIITPAQY